MDDLIRRQAAIDALEDAGMTNYQATGDFYGIINALTVIKNLPTAEKKGKWEIDVDCEYDIFDIAGERTWAVKAKCSECSFIVRFIEGHGLFNYCPNCGARMED